MLDFSLDNANFLILFSAYFALFAAVYGVSKGISLLLDKSQ